jgi:hypothetical protein
MSHSDRVGGGNEVAGFSSRVRVTGFANNNDDNGYGNRGGNRGGGGGNGGGNGNGGFGNSDRNGNGDRDRGGGFGNSDRGGGSGGNNDNYKSIFRNTSGDQGNSSGEISQSLPIPEYKMGWVIGKRGSYINQLQIKSGATITISDSVSREYGNVWKYIQISGSGRAVDRAKKLLHIRLERLEPKSDDGDKADDGEQDDDDIADDGKIE